MIEKDFYWLVGILEGEGYFGYVKHPIITVQMTDRDVVERVSRLFDRAVNTFVPKNENHKDVFITSIKGKPAYELMRKILPEMGNRRQKKIQEIILKFENKQTEKKNRKNDDRILVAKLFSEGKRSVEISKETGISRRSVYRRLKEYNKLESSNG